MVVYSNKTAAAAGAHIGAEIQLAVDVTNTIYANSGIGTRLRLAHSAPASYDKSNDFNTDLNRLTSSGDGYMDPLHGLRNTFGADMISLFVENGQYRGLAWVGPGGNLSVSDTGIGFWLSAGITWTLAEHVNLGGQAKFSSAEVTLAHPSIGSFDVDAGGSSLAVFVGVHF